MIASDKNEKIYQLQPNNNDILRLTKPLPVLRCQGEGLAIW